MINWIKLLDFLQLILFCFCSFQLGRIYQFDKNKRMKDQYKMEILQEYVKKTVEALEYERKQDL